MKIFIKNMVCDRCKTAVAEAAQALQLPVRRIELGELELDGNQPPAQELLRQLSERLKTLGFEIIGDKKGRLIEEIKKAVIDHVHKRDEFSKTNLSGYLEQKLHYDYSHLSHLYSTVEGTTIEQYAIRQRVERVKELIVYGEMSLTEIAAAVGYSSVGHLSRQFKQVTGLTPSFFRRKKDGADRKPLDQV